MAHISPDEAKLLAGIPDENRVRILCGYLGMGMSRKALAEDIFGDCSDRAVKCVSLLIHAYGFHQDRSSGRYPNIPEAVVEAFVREYDFEDYKGGLDEGTFDDFLFDYRRQLVAQQQREELQRRWQEEQEARQRQQQLEFARQYEDLQRQQEEERRQQEELEQQERLRREQEEQEQEALRQAAVAQGDHIRLMDEAFAALEQEDYALARDKAQQAWDLCPMTGLQYIFAFCAAGQGNRMEALKWAGKALPHYEEGSPEHLDLCILYLDNGGSNHAVDYGRMLHSKGNLDRLDGKGLAHLGTRVYASLFHMEAGLRLAYPQYTKDAAYMQFAEDLSLLIAERIPVNDASRSLLLNCAFVLTRRKHYRKALDIYEQYAEADRHTLDDPAYDLRAHRGFCYYGLGDTDSALHIWYPDLKYHPYYNTFPMDSLWAYHYDAVLRKLTDNHPDVKEHLEFTQDYVDGNIPGSDYYSRYYSNWREQLGLAPDEDTRWYCDDGGIWHVEVFTQQPSNSLTDKVKGFFNRLFGS